METNSKLGFICNKFDKVYISNEFNRITVFTKPGHPEYHGNIFSWGEVYGTRGLNTFEEAVDAAYKWALEIGIK